MGAAAKYAKLKIMPSEISSKADFSQIRYSQCWEDTDILLEALDIQPGNICLSIASAGDNTLAMLSRAPARVIAVDLSPAQIACLELRVAAYKELNHGELLSLIGSVPSDSFHRNNLYNRCRSQLSISTRQFWDKNTEAIAIGIGGIGKFEHYLAGFRRYFLPLIHSNELISHLLKGGTPEKRQAFYHHQWDNWRWQLGFRVFFSRFVLGRLGRDPSFFEYVNSKSVAEYLLERTCYAFTTLNPAENSYLQWIATGHHLTALPYALRPENFDLIRTYLDRLEWHCTSVEDFLPTLYPGVVDRYNLSNIFEYMSLDNYHRLLEQLANVGKSGGRLVYWNLLAKRCRPEFLSDRLQPLSELANRLYQQDKAFFYSAFIVEEII